MPTVITNTDLGNSLYVSPSNKLETENNYVIEFKSGILTTSFDAGYDNMQINSVTDVSGTPTTTITTGVGLTPYTLGDAIPIGTLINVTVSTSSTIRLNYSI
jgi:hypothetical protein